MKKRVVFLFAIILIMLLVISFAGCENNGENQLPGDSNVTDDKQNPDDGQEPSEPEYTPTEGLSYILNGDGNGYTVSGEGTATDTDIVIPFEHNGLPVTSIGYEAFAWCDSLTSVVIPDSVTSIWDDAFYECASLQYNEYNNAYYLGNENNPYLALIKARNTDITSCDVHVNTKIIVGEAFSSCTSLTSIVIPDSVTSIGNHAFRSCTSLTSVTIGNSVTSIGSYAFSDCASLQYNEYNNAYYLGNENNLYLALIEAKSEDIISCNIHNNTKIIANNAFDSCDSLTSIDIPDSVTSIGDEAFYDCDSLTSIVIPDSVTVIGNEAFYDCDSLTSITVDENNTAFASIDGNLYNKDKTTLIQYAIGKTATEFTIPDDVTSIGSSAFESCDSLTSIVIPDSVTSIGEDAFAWCDSLTSVTIGNSVTSIGDEAFAWCYSLTSVTIPDSVTSIGSSAFSSCYSLTSVTIGNGVTSIGDYAFFDCDSLTDVYYSGTEEQWNGISIGSENRKLTSANIHFSADTGS